MSIVARHYSKRFGWGRNAPGEWNPDGSVVRAVQSVNFAACGCRIRTGQDKPWNYESHAPVNCKRCLKILSKAAR